jgi:hypothetical protein
MTRTTQACRACKTERDDDLPYCTACRNNAIVDRLDALHLAASPCDLRCREYGIEKIQYFAQALGHCPCVGEA